MSYTVRHSVAFIVNMEYTDSLNSQDICLTGGKKFIFQGGL